MASDCRPTEFASNIPTGIQFSFLYPIVMERGVTTMLLIGRCINHMVKMITMEL